MIIVPCHQIPAADLTRAYDKRCGWLCKTGLNNTKLARRYCIIQGGKLFYYLGPRVDCLYLTLFDFLCCPTDDLLVWLMQSEAPNGIVILSGAVVQQSDHVPYGFEIVAGELYSSQHIMKRTYYFTPAGAGNATPQHNGNPRGNPGWHHPPVLC